MRIHHIGIVVNNIDEALKLYHNMLGLTPVHTVRSSPEHGLKMVSVPVGGSDEAFIEMIEPIGSESRFAKHLKERGEGLFHIAIFAEDWDEKIRELKEKGFIVEVQEVKAPGVSGTLKLGWLQPEDTRGVWIELINIDTPPL